MKAFSAEHFLRMLKREGKWRKEAATQKAPSLFLKLLLIDILKGGQNKKVFDLSLDIFIRVQFNYASTQVETRIKSQIGTRSKCSSYASLNSHCVNSKLESKGNSELVPSPTLVFLSSDV